MEPPDPKKVTKWVWRRKKKPPDPEKVTTRVRRRKKKPPDPNQRDEVIASSGA